MKKIISFIIVLIIMLVDSQTAFADNVNIFSDISEDSEYYESIYWALNEGIIVGTGNNKFEPDIPITHRDAIVIISRYINKSAPLNDWAEEKEIRVLQSTYAGWVNPGAFDVFNNKIPYIYATSIIVDGLGINFNDNPDTSKYLTNFEFLIDSHIIDSNINRDDIISRAQFIDLFYKIINLNHDLSPVESQYETILNEFNQLQLQINLEDKISIVPYDAFYRTFDNIPETIRNRFIEYGWTIYVDKELLEEEYADIFDFSIGGVCDSLNKRIIINSSEYLYHEVGHFLHFEEPGIITNIMSCFINEKDAIFDNYPTGPINLSEFFARAFDKYISGKYGNQVNSELILKSLKENAPQTFAFMEELENNNWTISSEQVGIQ